MRREHVGDLAILLAACRAASRAPRTPRSARRRRAPGRTSRPTSLRDLLERLGVRWHANDPAEASGQLLLDDAVRRADENRVDRHAAPLRLLRGLGGLDLAAVPRAVGDDARSRAAEPPASFLPSGCPTRSDSATASPIAVPSPGVSVSSAVTTSSRSSVGATPTTARVANETTPTRNFSGTSSRKVLAAVLAASRRVGSTSVRLHRARDVHREHDRRLLTRHAHGRMRSRDADDQEDERDEHDQRRQVAQAAGLAIDHVGQQVRDSRTRPATRHVGGRGRCRARRGPGRGERDRARAAR